MSKSVTLYRCHAAEREWWRGRVRRWREGGEGKEVEGMEGRGKGREVIILTSILKPKST